jgi:hypothetical protein
MRNVTFRVLFSRDRECCSFCGIATDIPVRKWCEKVDKNGRQGDRKVGKSGNLFR